MHGDETVGYVLLLRMADYLLSNYGTDTEVTNLVNNMEISINPLANPDGTFRGSASGTDVSSATRYNANNIDLNRNFPTLNGDSYTLQPEIQCMMDYSDIKDYDMSVNTHGGVELINFPWDTWQSWESMNADHNWWEYVCFVYADQVEIDAPSSYFEGPGNMSYGPDNYTGVTHGADWYYAIGSRQDYMNYYRYIQEVTLELSDTKLLAVEYLNDHWGYNKQAMLNYMEEALNGFRGIVTDACTGAPLADVKVEIIGHDSVNSEVYSNAPVGDYHRPIYEGSYDVTYSLAGYQSQTHTVTVINGQETRLDVELIPDGIASPQFTVSSTSIFEGESVDFTDQSTGTVSSYNWTFEAGTPSSSTDIDPAAIIYNTAGVYDVSLEIVSMGCTVSLTIPDYIEVSQQIPVVANFEADATSVTQGTTVNFTDLSTNNPDSWSWTFSGGTPNSSADQNPSVVYDTPGIYTVELTASNNYGADTETKVDYIEVTEPDVLMSNGITYSCSGLFKDNGGDANYTDNIQLTHTIYPETAGSYVRLTFTDLGIEPNGNDCYDFITIYDGETTGATEIGTYCGTDATVIGTNGVVTANNPSGALTIFFDTDNNTNDIGWVAEISCYSPTTPPVAAFESDVTSTCTGQVNFTDLSTDGPTEWLWNFGDSETSTEQNPIHFYTQSGTYTVSLTVSNANGSDVETHTDLIVVDLPVAPTAADVSRCGEGTVELSATGSGLLEWYDSAVDGNLLTTGSTYTSPVLTETTSYFVQSLIEQTSQYVGETASSGAGGQIYTYNSQHYLVFDAYTDLTIVSVEVNASGAGTRLIELQDNTGATVQSADVFIEDGISRITLNFDVPAGTEWRLAGPNSPNLFRSEGGLSYPYEIPGLVSINYSSAGTTPTGYYYYFYDWEVKEASCISARTEVTAIVNDLPVVEFSGNSEICANDAVTITASGGNEYLWSTGATSESITEVLTETTGFTVTVVDVNTCSNTGSFDVTVLDLPMADAGEDQLICNGSSASLEATGGTTYLWNTGETTQAIDLFPSATTSYYVTVSDAQCSDVDTVIVEVAPNPEIVISSTNESTTGAFDGNASSSVTSGTQPYNYSWSNGETTSSIENLSAGEYSLTVVDDNGC
ncbi:MAG: hypothetical protein C0594_06585 [Marinilabiliales bacterium]|nr:MAG: hypothetical protein C0594_06585 [Marinilabiliales bacterium]